jgi:hypothetical protein
VTGVGVDDDLRAPPACAAAISASKSAMVPNSGSTPV